MISKEFIEHVYNGVRYYEYQGVYFYREEGLFSDEKFMELMRGYSVAINNAFIYINRDKNGFLRCSYDVREDCEQKKQIDGMKIMYCGSDIDFADKNAYSFVRQCWQERTNHNVICFIYDGLNHFGRDNRLTLKEFFRKYCREETIDK
jgi:hypothetical protein